MAYLWLKSLHIIGFVTWFAGLFYLARLFVYHAEAKKKSAVEWQVLHPQFSLMEKRLFYIITWPGMVFTLGCGTGMIYLNPAIFTGWLHIKLAMVVALAAYHIVCGSMLKRFASGNAGYSSGQMRMWNEIPTLLLVGIVLIAVLKNTLSFAKAFAVLFILGILLFAGIRIYKRFRSEN